ncbi:MAG: phosphotransferase [Gammaproteobacteria bacterium]|nr:phosphotransferase [Gammaproteobacteria bacterium]
MTDNPGSDRQQQLFLWVSDQLNVLNLTDSSQLDIHKASDDASFRRYFRATVAEKSFIIMDAPPDRENCRPFVQVETMMHAKGISVPDIYAVDLDQGFMLLTDFGQTDYLTALESGKNTEVRDRLYDDALLSLLKIQQIDDCGQLPIYNEQLLRQEMNLFREWFLPKLLQLSISEEESALIDTVFGALVANALEQPLVLVHRDYHSRNLMYLENREDFDNPGILDFQDAVRGPVTYDLVSLLKDCYIRWPDDWVYARVADHHERLIDAGLLDSSVDRQIFERWFDLMGLQRHIKVAGIFSRLKFRDGKERYLQDIPLVVNYITRMLEKYDEFLRFNDWFKVRLVPAMKARGVKVL